jgi:hypothetical protein
MMMTVGIAILSALTGCDRSGSELVPRPSDAFPGVVEAGELVIITSDDLDTMNSIGPDYCEDDGSGKKCIYGQVGATEQGKKGGATFTFTATGGDVCVITDPEAVFWSTSIAPANPNESYIYPDNTVDDGDIDLQAGLSSYYTGSPGVELGAFSGYYTDSLGREIEISYSECSQVGYQSQTDAQAGRAAIEYCDIATEGREGAQYTVVLSTFAVPLDDGVLSFAAVVVEGKCSRVGSLNECTLLGESLDENGVTRTCSESMEVAACDGGAEDLPYFCCANPDMCGDDPPTEVCLNFDRTAWCSENPDLCCF